MGSQKHTSILKDADEAGSLQWDWNAPLVTQVPLANTIFKHTRIDPTVGTAVQVAMGT